MKPFSKISQFLFIIFLLIQISPGPGNNGVYCDEKKNDEPFPQSQPQLAARLEEYWQRVRITVDGKLFTCYKYHNLQKFPYFWPVHGPASGASVTTETSWPYPHHQSLYFGCDRVNGGNYWQEGIERGQILSQGPKIIEDSGNRIILTDECLWKQPKQDPIIRDIRRITITAPNSKLRLIDFEITLQPITDVVILKSNHSLFAARVDPDLSVVSGGVLINAGGKTSEKGTFGVPSPWCDYSGTRNGITEGIAIVQHPANRWYPSPWFTRDYGFFSPTPMFWLENDRLELPKGGSLALRYRVVIHAGNAEEAGIEEIFNQYK